MYVPQYVTFILTVAHIASIVHLENTFGLVVSLIFLILAMYNGFHACRIDPTDPLIYQQRYFAKNKAFKEHLKSKFKKTCSIEKSFIHENTRHCVSCNRCCYNFDHHCLYLNNCIGSDNYVYFMRSMIFIVLFIVCVLFIQARGILMTRDR